MGLAAVSAPTDVWVLWADPPKAEEQSARSSIVERTLAEEAEVRLAAEELVLGYAFVGVGEASASDGGPFIQAHRYNPRPTTDANLDKFYDFVHQGALLFNLEVPYAVLCAVDPDVVDLSSLTKDPASSHRVKDVRWTKKAGGGATGALNIINGHHRIELVRRRVLAEPRKVLAALHSDIQRGKVTGDRKEKLQAAVDVQTTAIRERGRWIVKFYDKGGQPKPSVGGGNVDADGTTQGSSRTIRCSKSLRCTCLGTSWRGAWRTTTWTRSTCCTTPWRRRRERTRRGS